MALTSPLRRLARIALIGCLFVVVPMGLRADGALTNGQNHSGVISAAGEIDIWTFDATQGERIVLAIGETGADTAFVPWIRILRPDNAAMIGNAAGVLATQIQLTAPVTGTYTVQVASNDSGNNDTGSYVLTLAKSPGAFSISPGDDGGPLTNGSNHTGTIHVGDLDMWSFTATAGEAIMLAIGEVGNDPSGFQPWIRLQGPTGADIDSTSGVLAAQIDVTAAATGTYTVIVSTFDSGFDATGAYTLTLARGMGAFTVGDDGGPLTNGSNHTGTVHVGDLDIWNFTATAGEAIMLAIGEVGNDPSGFQPWIRLQSPTGADIESTSGVLAAQIDVTAAATGTYTVIVSTFDSGFDATGAYTLTLAKGMGAFTPGDEGGPLTNGANHTGAIHVGDLDMWSFTASAGEAIMLAIGEVGNDPSGFQPWIRLQGPTGADIDSTSGVLAAQIDVTAAATGTYTVIVSTFDSGFDATGAYTLTLAKGTGAFTPGDEGGPLTNGANHTGAIHVGDLDMWSFTANAGESIMLAIGEVGNDPSGFQPWIRLQGPTGADIASTSGVLAAQIDVTAAATGTYTVIVSTFDSGFDATGAYTLTTSNTPRPFVVPVGDEGGRLSATVEGGGIVHIGDLDTWDFVAHEGDALVVTISETIASTEFTPWIRLRSPTGTVIGSTSGASTASIHVAAPATGFYTITVSSFDSGFDGFGEYTLAVSGPSDSMIKNGKFDQGELFWQFFATPTLAHIVHSVVNGVLHYFRVPPPPGTSNQAVAFQETGVSLPAFAPVVAKFDLANTSAARRRIAVLILDSAFQDLSVCTFWMAPNAPLRTYSMRTHTTQAWNNAALYFYAASEGGEGGVYQIDNVSMAYDPELPDDRTDCVDPTTVAPRSIADGPNLIANGDFGTGQLAPWTTFSFIDWQISGGVFEFVKPNNNSPSGVVLQPTGQAMAAGETLTATFQLGNSSTVRKRVTVILGDQDFSDISACTFWLQPGQPLSTYVYRTFVTDPWQNALLSVYPATAGLQQWMRLDNVTLQRTPSAPVVGTECIEPGPESQAIGAAALQAPVVVAAAEASPLAAAGGAPVTVPGSFIEVTAGSMGTHLVAMAEVIDLRNASASVLAFDSLLTGQTGAAPSALVQASVDGDTWVTLKEVPASDDWVPIAVDLSALSGHAVRLRFVLDVREPVTTGAQPSWKVGNLRILR